MTTPTLSERLRTRMATTYQMDGLLNEAAAALDARNSELDRLRDECARLRALLVRVRAEDETPGPVDLPDDLAADIRAALKDAP